MFTLSISADSLKALALCASKSDVRHYLNGVCVDLTTEGRVHLLTTDGHRMLIVGNAKLEGERVNGRYILPIEAIKGIKAERHNPVSIEIVPASDNVSESAGTFTIRGKLTTTGDLIEGRYPEWQRVMPQRRELSGETPCEVGHFNLGFLGDYGRAGELLGCKHPYLVHNGPNHSAYVYLGANAFGIVMPMRITDCGAADWLAPIKAEVEEMREAA